MEPDPTSLDPGSMTVPPLFGWQHIVVVLALMAVVGAAFLLHSVARGSAHSRYDWQSWLDARSGRELFPAGTARPRTAEVIHSSRVAFPATRDDDSRPLADGPG